MKLVERALSFTIRAHDGQYRKHDKDTPYVFHPMVDKRNFRNLVDMSHQRKCTRAYWEYRQLFNDYEQALRNYSEEWNTLCNLFIPKCEYFGFCKENKTCGRKPKFNLDTN